MSNQNLISIVGSILHTLVGLSVSIFTFYLIPVYQVKALSRVDSVEEISSEINPQGYTQSTNTPLDRSAITERSLLSGQIAQAESLGNSTYSDTVNLVVTQVGKKYGYQDAEGHTAIAAQFDDVYDFFEGLAAVNINNKWGFIDQSGNLIVTMQYDNASSFSNGLAAVKLGEKWGFIDRQGVTKISHSFDEAETFSEGLAKVKVGDKWGYIDQVGVMKIEPIFDEAASFDNNTAWVRIGNKVGYIDKSGKFVISSS